MRLLALLLLAAPLGAQVEQRTLVPDVNVNEGVRELVPPVTLAAVTHHNVPVPKSESSDLTYPLL